MGCRFERQRQTWVCWKQRFNLCWSVSISFYSFFLSFSVDLGAWSWWCWSTTNTTLSIWRAPIYSESSQQVTFQLGGKLKRVEKPLSRLVLVWVKPTTGRSDAALGRIWNKKQLSESPLLVKVVCVFWSLWFVYWKIAMGFKLWGAKYYSVLSVVFFVSKLYELVNMLGGIVGAAFQFHLETKAEVEKNQLWYVARREICAVVNLFLQLVFLAFHFSFSRMRFDCCWSW